MERGHQVIAIEASSLAKALPNSLMQIVADAVESCGFGNWPALRHQLTNGVAHAHYRSLVGNFLDCWKSHAADVSVDAVASALRTAGYSEKAHQDSQAVELVWTGPETGAISWRRMEQALLQLIDGANDRVLVVSYAVYNIPWICDSLVRAADRGSEDQCGRGDARSPARTIHLQHTSGSRSPDRSQVERLLLAARQSREGRKR